MTTASVPLFLERLYYKVEVMRFSQCRPEGVDSVGNTFLARPDFGRHSLRKYS